ncbi:MAG: hypothetical protein AB7F76_01410 [Parvibaculaceae bacterium]
MLDKPLRGSKISAMRPNDAVFMAPVRGWLKAGQFFARIASFCLSRALRRSEKERARFHRDIAKCIREDSLTG